MENPNPATPPIGATPGNGDQGKPQVPAVPPTDTKTGPGAQPGTQVVISAEEYAKLKRAEARTLSFERRAEFKKKNAQPQGANGDSSDPTLLAEQQARADADRRAFKAEVTLQVRDILDKPEYKSLPASTRALILRNPGMLSDANSVEEAMLDIEDFVRENIEAIPVTTQKSETTPSPGNNQNLETPPAPGTGPAPTKGIELEDISKLTGTARSRAVLRNKIRQSQGVK